ncbi:unnamed protein product [Caenorhabditis sp. 36 PRJEB53466]|nr:unnamed protein product [Caenorhabditis sp. 36 PRJEB53466]
MSSIRVVLKEQAVWKEFNSKTTEMIVTKKKGRVLFPHLDYVISGLDPKALYRIHCHLERVDNIKYKFDHCEWQEAAKGDPPITPIRVEHPDGARPGEHWMRDAVSFASLKITNDPQNENRRLILVQSMHKYLPVVTITRFDNARAEEFRIRETEFVVVTAYQSDEMIKLKVAHNKFASGFRQTGGKRRLSDESEENEPPKRRPDSVHSSTSCGSSATVSPIDWEQQQQPQGYGMAMPMPMMMNLNAQNYWGQYWNQWNYQMNPMNFQNFQWNNNNNNNNNSIIPPFAPQNETPNGTPFQNL